MFLAYWPWDPNVDAFWKSVAASAVVFIPTVALALGIENWRRRSEALKRVQEDRRVRSALVVGVFREAISNLSWARVFHQKAAAAKSSGQFQELLSGRPRDSMWNASKRELLALGLPGDVFHTVERAYECAERAGGWADLMEDLLRQRRILSALGSAHPEAEELRTQILSEVTARRMVESFNEAITALQRFADHTSVDLKGAYGQPTAEQEESGDRGVTRAGADPAARKDNTA